MTEPKIRVCVLVLALIILNSMPTIAEDWDGIVCYAGNKANPKTCKSCVTVYTDCNFILLLIFSFFFFFSNSKWFFFFGFIYFHIFHFILKTTIKHQSIHRLIAETGLL